MKQGDNIVLYRDMSNTKTHFYDDFYSNLESKEEILEKIKALYKSLLEHQAFQDRKLTPVEMEVVNEIN